MKHVIENKFHGTEMKTNIKKEYASTMGVDVLASLDYEVYSQGPDVEYAKNKLKEIKKGLCGVRGCGCVCTVKKGKQ